MDKYVLEAKKLEIGYGKQSVVRGLDLQVEKGKSILLLGANGCGKSTLLMTLAGLKKQRAGEILMQGEALSEKERRTRVGYVTQGNALLGELTVRDNLELWYGGRKIVKQMIVGGAFPFDTLRMEELLKKRVQDLSGGMARRVAIACAMAGNPELLLLDEPGAALDFACKELLHEAIREYISRGGTALLSSHDRKDFEVADLLYVMRDGKLHEVNRGMTDAELVAEF